MYMFAIITVTGTDHPGIIAAVTTSLAENNANILDMSQTIMGEYFTMILRVEFDEDARSIDEIQDALLVVEKAQNLVIRVQSEDLFTAMNEL